MTHEESTLLLHREPEGKATLDARGYTLRSKTEATTVRTPSFCVGSHPANDLCIKDPSVSRFHFALEMHSDGILLIDQGSTNGTFINHVKADRCWLSDGHTIRFGAKELSFHLEKERYRIPLHQEEHFGSLVGRSTAMRRVFALLARAAPSEATVLLQGETGTGKEACAETIHNLSDRRDAPFLVVDAGAIPSNLLESELFGHEKGSFTGAHRTHIGAFEAANGGTVFLDEIGELPPDLQPKLLRVLERKTIRRVGDTAQRPVDVRIVAATHRNLREAVNQGHFRADLYYRLAVVPITLPPLRERPDDIPLLVEHLLEGMPIGPEDKTRMLHPGRLAELQGGGWPGNVRELRNHLERCLVMGDAMPLPRSPSADRQGVDARLTYQEARRRALDAFEAEYLGALLELCGDNVSKASRQAEINRPYLYRLLRRHGIR